MPVIIAIGICGFVLALLFSFLVAPVLDVIEAMGKRR